MRDEPLAPAASPVDLSTINANIATIRADMREVKASLPVLGALKADMAAVMMDVVRLEQKFAGMAADLQKILQHVTKK